MHSTWFLTFVALLPIVICRYSNVGKHKFQEMNELPQRHLRNGNLAKRPLMPSLKIRNGPPQTLQVPAAESTILECEAGGNPPPTIHWLKDGKRIPQSVYEAVHLGNDEEEDPIPLLGLSFTRSRLYVDCVGPREEGMYTCVAQNAFHKTSQSTILRILDFSEEDQTAICLAKKSFSAPARIHMWTHNRLELIGSDVQLFCRSDGVPQPKVTWLGPNDLPLPTDTDKYEILENGDLLIRTIKWADMGDYTCEVQNAQGSDSTRTFLYPTQPSKRKENEK